MFNYLPTKIQNFVVSLIIGQTAYSVLTSLEDDIVFAINGDDRSFFIGLSSYGLWRYVFRAAVIFACVLTLKKNSRNGVDTVV